MALPFGLRSAPKIFTAVADALAWAMMVNGATGFLHYLDDFLFVGPRGSHITNTSLEVALSTCATISFPVSHQKTVYPSTTLTFLGIEINTDAGTLSLPREKLIKLKAMLSLWHSRKAAPKRDLLSLLGHLAHASTVIHPGRTFVRHLIEASTLATAPHHYIRLNRQCRADLLWWLDFGLSWNGTSLWPPTTPSITCCSDASGSWGCAAIQTHPAPHSWFQVPWPTTWAGRNIAAKELTPVVVAAAIWGPNWWGQKVLFLSDNMAAVAAICSGAAKDPSIRHLLRCLFFFAAAWQ